VAPLLSSSQQYITNDMGPLGYCHLLAVGALDGLVEASRQSRVCAGVANEVACTIFRWVFDAGKYLLQVPHQICTEGKGGGWDSRQGACVCVCLKVCVIMYSQNG